VFPLLFVGDFASTAPAADQVVGSDMTFDYFPSAFGGSVWSIRYEIRNTGDNTITYNNLRLMLDVRAKGQPATLDTASAEGFGAPAGPGDPANFQIFDFDAPGDKPIQLISAANQLNGTNACGAGCFADLALQWNLASLAPGALWTVSVALVDDPALVAGGRYLVATSLGNGNQLFVGNPVLVPEPETCALLAAGLGLLSWMRLRRRAAH
jgi:hypothetical protein